MHTSDTHVGSPRSVHYGPDSEDNRESAMSCRLFRGVGYLLMWVIVAVPVSAEDWRDEEIRQLRQELNALQDRLDKLERDAADDRERRPDQEVLRNREIAEARIEPLLEGEDTLEARQRQLQVPEVLAPGVESLRFKGALRFNASLRDFDQGSKDRKGDSGLELFRIGVDGSIDQVRISAEYRFYPYMDAIHHGWIGYDLEDFGIVKLGISQVPFGILPYAAHNYWFGVPYYLGLADDYDLGIQYLYEDGPWDLRLAFFKNSELGDASNLERYAFDIVRLGEQQNEETNQFNARLAHTFSLPSGSSHEVGLSVQYGGLYNRTTGRNGHHWAVGTHWDARVGRFAFQTQLARYEYHPENPEGVDDATVLLGALGTSYEVAARGTVAVANIAYTFPLTSAYIDQLTIYNDYSILFKDFADFEESQINTTGVGIGKDPLFLYVDLIQAKNMPFFGSGSLAGDGETSWKTRLNFNLGYYW